MIACLVAFGAGCTTTEVARTEAPSPPSADAGPEEEPGQEVAVLDESGKPVPVAAADTARRAHTALVDDDVPALGRLYREPRAGAPSRERTLARLDSESAREALAETLRTPPTAEPNGDVLYSHGNYGLVVTPDGAITYLGGAEPPR